MDENLREANDIIEDLNLADLNEEFVNELRDSLVSFLDDGILLDAHADDNEDVVNVHLIQEMGICRVEYQKNDGAWFTHFLDRDICQHAVNVWTTNVPDEDGIMVGGVNMSFRPLPESPDSVEILFSKGEPADGTVIDQYEFDLCEVYPVMKELVDRVEEVNDGTIRWRYDFVPEGSVYEEPRHYQ